MVRNWALLSAPNDRRPGNGSVKPLPDNIMHASHVDCGAYLTWDGHFDVLAGAKYG